MRGHIQDTGVDDSGEEAVLGEASIPGCDSGVDGNEQWGVEVIAFKEAQELLRLIVGWISSIRSHRIKYQCQVQMGKL